MKVREVTVPSGEHFVVPQGIQRIDSKSTHGWQVRYQGTKMFSDGPLGGARPALKQATAELLQRIATLPAPVTLQKAPCAHKGSNLPSGISGPIVRERPQSQFRSASFSVLLPRFGQTARCATVYIGSENTYSERRYRAALAKAVALRQQAEAQYQEDATQARRQEARRLRAAVKRASGPR